MNTIFDIKGLSTGYEIGKPVLKDIYLTLQAGEICSILGEEGAGKTTLLKALIGRLPYIGQIVWQGNSLQEVPTHRLTKLGIDYNLAGGNILKNFSVYEHLELAMQYLPKKQQQNRWEELQIQFPRLKDLKNRKGGQLSGGERMIVTIAALASNKPQLLLLDEPTAGLSEAMTNEIAQQLRHLSDKFGTTILVLEHNYSFALSLSDSIVTLKEQSLSQKSSKDSFLANTVIDQLAFT